MLVFFVPLADSLGHGAQYAQIAADLEPPD
jgi:hypothetical protein